MHYTPQEKHILQEDGLKPRRRLRLRHVALVTGGIIAASLAVAGCGGGPSTPGVATGSATANTVGPSAGASTQAAGLVAYASCMRSHGVPDFPDPASGGGIPKQAAVSAFQAVSNSEAEAAQNACRYLLPVGGSLSGQALQTITLKDRQDYLKAAACMRSHGFPGFPDPTFPNDSVQTNIPSSIDQNSSPFHSAATLCTKLIPAGLPDNRPGAS
jgi:hypothetical protein